MKRPHGSRRAGGRGQASNGRSRRASETARQLEAAAAAEQAAAEEAAAEAAAEADLADLFARLATHAKALFEAAREFATLGWKRLKLRAVDGAFSVVLAFVAAIAGLTIVISSALLVVNGLRHALARWTGADWVGELVGGALTLALPFAALLVIRGSARRKMLQHALHPSMEPKAEVETPVNAPASEPQPASAATAASAADPRTPL